MKPPARKQPCNHPIGAFDKDGNEVCGHCKAVVAYMNPHDYGVLKVALHPTPQTDLEWLRTTFPGSIVRSTMDDDVTILSWSEPTGQRWFIDNELVATRDESHIRMVLGFENDLGAEGQYVIADPKVPNWARGHKCSYAMEDVYLALGALESFLRVVSSK